MNQHQNPRESTPDPNAKKHIYRGGTTDALSAMLHMAEAGLSVDEAFNLILQEENEQSRVLYIPENLNDKKKRYLRYCVPSDLDRSNTILLEPLAEGLKKGELALDYYHIKPSMLSMLITPGYKHRGVQRNHVLCALLMPCKLVELDDANHILMELGMAGLYDNTGNYQDNKRNRMLASIFEYARENDCPQERWLFLANDMLRQKGLKPLYRDKDDCRPDPDDAAQKLFDRWEAEAKASALTGGYMKFRRECFDRYCSKLGLSITAAQEQIADRVSIGVDSVKNILCASQMSSKTRSSRHTLALMAIELGCDLDEGNRLLMEAGYSMLYPFRESDEDRFYIYRLLENKLRKPR